MRTKTLEQNSAQDFAGLQVDQLQKLRNGNITFEQVKWFNNLSFEQREKLINKHPEMVIYLELLSGAETLMIDVCDGKETLAEARDVFQAGVDGDFVKWGLNKESTSTKEAPVEVHQLVKDATFAQMFGSLGTDLDKLCLTQHQIKNFCKKYSNWLRTGSNSTFFLFKVADQFFVAGVEVRSDVLRVYVYRFRDDNVWGIKYGHLLVLPQLAA